MISFIKEYYQDKRVASVFLLTLAAVILRLATIDATVKGDEAATFLVHGLFPWRKLFLSYQDPTQHTLFTAFSRLSMALFGENEITFRLPSLLAGTLAVPLLYSVGRRLVNARVAVIACTFLVFSFPHVTYSQDGRGYALTVFFAVLTLLCMTRLNETPNSKAWGLVLALSGFGMVLIVPSNLFFVSAASVFFAINILEKRRLSGFSVRGLIVTAFPLLVMGMLVLGYFMLIFKDLQRGVLSYQEYARLFEGINSLKMTPERFLQVLQVLVDPWGLWLYLFAGYGGICLWREGKSLAFLTLFFVPVALVWVAGILGPPRVYLYWLPFVFLCVAFGIERLAFRLKNILPGKWGVSLTVIFCVVMVMFPVFRLVEYYPTRMKNENSSMFDAKQALSYVLEKIPKNHLIVIPFTDKVLRHYLEELAANRMLDVLKGELLKSIIFIGDKKISPQNIPFAGFNAQPSPLQENSFELVREIGGLNVYALNVNIVRLAPAGFDPDYEAHLGFEDNADVRVQRVPLPRIVGKEALAVEKKVPGKVLLSAGLLKVFDIKRNGYLLSVYAQGYQQRSHVAMADSGAVPRIRAYLNYYLGVFGSDGIKPKWQLIHPYLNFLKSVEDVGANPANSLWQIAFFLSPLGKGMHGLAETIEVGDRISMFDGMQTYFLERNDVAPERGNK